MHLVDAVKIGRFCGLTNVEDCIGSAERHSISFWKYSDIPNELRELHADYDLYLKGEYELDLVAIDKENSAITDRMFEEEEEFHRNNPNAAGDQLEFNFEAWDNKV